jgi:hypothetical protein
MYLNLLIQMNSEVYHLFRYLHDNNMYYVAKNQQNIFLGSTFYQVYDEDFSQSHYFLKDCILKFRLKIVFLFSFNQIFNTQRKNEFYYYIITP